ncbi:MAG: membrane protein insertase YidC [Akkermansiaceae bacterium]
MDRKGWIILALCGVLLALNFYFAPEPQPVTPQAESPLAEDTADDSSGQFGEPLTNKPGLVIEPYVPPVGENTVSLESYQDGEKKVIYTFTSQGGGLKTIELLDQFAVGSKTQHVVLNEDAPAPVGAICNAPDKYLSLNYELRQADGAIYCEATTAGGLKITKRWSLEKDQSAAGAPWLLKLAITFRNNSPHSELVSLSNYSIFTGAASPLHARELEAQGGFFLFDDGSLTSKDGNWFSGGFFKKAKPLFQQTAGSIEYAGVSNQFFTTLVRPTEKYASVVWAKSNPITIPGANPEKPKKAIRLGFSLPVRDLAQGDSATLRYSIYTGPKDYSELRKMEDGTAKVMNYGWFTPVSVLQNNVLNWFHDVVFSKTADKWAWGLSIIALTILIRTCIWPLHNKSTRTMKRMSKLGPIIKELREKHKDNPTKLNQETMKLYKEYQVNPMGGCLPMFLQIPIFFGYYKMLQYAVELRGERFLWVDDLSMPDTIHAFDLPFELPLLGSSLPINLLPILMAVTMIIQMKLTPKAGDPMQQKLMMFMPFMFFFFCYNFASALALYWTTQNIFSIGQTWLTNRLPEPELTKRKPKKTDPTKPVKKSFMERMAEKAEEMQRVKEAGGKQPMRNATPDKSKDKPKKRTPKTGG